MLSSHSRVHHGISHIKQDYHLKIHGILTNRIKEQKYFLFHHLQSLGLQANPLQRWYIMYAYTYVHMYAEVCIYIYILYIYVYIYIHI
jgi:hypothetical protein